MCRINKKLNKKSFKLHWMLIIILLNYRANKLTICGQPPINSTTFSCAFSVVARYSCCIATQSTQKISNWQNDTTQTMLHNIISNRIIFLLFHIVQNHDVLLYVEHTFDTVWYCIWYSTYHYYDTCLVQYCSNTVLYSSFFDTWVLEQFWIRTKIVI